MKIEIINLLSSSSCFCLKEALRSTVVHCITTLHLQTIECFPAGYLEPYQTELKSTPLFDLYLESVAHSLPLMERILQPPKESRSCSQCLSASTPAKAALKRSKRS